MLCSITFHNSPHTCFDDFCVFLGEMGVLHTMQSHYESTTSNAQGVYLLVHAIIDTHVQQLVHGLLDTANPAVYRECRNNWPQTPTFRVNFSFSKNVFCFLHQNYARILRWGTRRNRLSTPTVDNGHSQLQSDTVRFAAETDCEVRTVCRRQGPEMIMVTISLFWFILIRILTKSYQKLKMNKDPLRPLVPRFSLTLDISTNRLATGNILQTCRLCDPVRMRFLFENSPKSTKNMKIVSEWQNGNCCTLFLPCTL